MRLGWWKKQTFAARHLIFYKFLEKNTTLDDADSVYRQNLLQGQFFKTLQEKGMYINQPDNYFFQGGSKTGKSLQIRRVRIFFFKQGDQMSL
jgi:hypothetical protein